MRYTGYALLIALLSTTCSAREINFSQPIVDLDGKSVPSSTSEGAPPLDLKMVAGIALLTDKPPDPRTATPDAANKLHRFTLAVKIHLGGVIDLSAEEIAEVKAAIAGVWPTLVFGRAAEILDPAGK
jgi:hypothetical protein